jgi:hypothetical protein
MIQNVTEETQGEYDFSISSRRRCSGYPSVEKTREEVEESVFHRRGGPQKGSSTCRNSKSRSVEGDNQAEVSQENYFNPFSPSSAWPRIKASGSVKAARMACFAAIAFVPNESNAQRAFWRSLTFAEVMKGRMAGMHFSGCLAIVPKAMSAWAWMICWMVFMITFSLPKKVNRRR